MVSKSRNKSGAMRPATHGRFPLLCPGRSGYSFNKEAGGLPHKLLSVPIPEQALSNAPVNLLHTMSQNVILISSLQTNKSVLRG